MKRLIAILLAMVMVLSLTACGSLPLPGKKDDASSVESSAEKEEKSEKAEEAEETEAPEKTEEKKDEEVSAAEPAPAEAPASASTAGYYEVSSMAVGDATLGVNSLADRDITPDNTYVVLDGEGGGVISLFDGEEMKLTLDTRFMIVDGDAVEYKLEGETLTIIVPDEEDGEDTTLTFIRTGDKRPESSGTLAIEPTKPQETTPPENVSTEPVSADFGDYHVTILSAEPFTDGDDKDGVRFYYDFTNNSDEATCAMFELNLKASQDDYELVTTWTMDDAPEYGNDIRNVRPGVTIRCCEEYNFKPTGGPLIFTVSDYSGEELSMQFDPQNLPGRPADEWTITPIANPDWMGGIPEEGDIEDYHVKIVKAEGGEDYAGDPLCRVYFDFTNNSQETTTFLMALDLNVMQDGIEIPTTFTMDDIPEEDNYTVDVAPGETITVARTSSLRTDSPVTVEIYDFMSGKTYIGTTITVAN